MSRNQVLFSKGIHDSLVSSVFLILNKMSGTSFSTRTLDITEDIAVFNECANLSGKAFSQVMEHYKISVACVNSFSAVSNRSQGTQNKQSRGRCGKQESHSENTRRTIQKLLEHCKQLINNENNEVVTVQEVQETHQIIEVQKPLHGWLKTLPTVTGEPVFTRLMLRLLC